jgi:hypothetical protein
VKHYGSYVVLVLLGIVALSSFSFALEEKIENGVIIHDSSNVKLVNSFVEDVVTLLPPEMVKTLEPHLDILTKEANFTVRDDYWRRKVITLNNFKGRLELIPIKDGAVLASQLGEYVKPIFEIALRPNGSDVMGEGLKKNLKEALTGWKNGKHVINYTGYKDQPLEVVLGTLYGFAKYNKSTLYPELVITTANLWSAIWKNGGGETQMVAKSIIRKPAEFNFRKSAAPAYRK